MIVKSFSGVREGDFIRGHGTRCGVNWAQVWWKVVEVTKDEIVAVNRSGRIRRHTWQMAKDIGPVKFKTWQPGDPREDGDNL